MSQAVSRLIALVIFVLAIVLASALFKSAPPPVRHALPPAIPKVEVHPITLGNNRPVWTSGGVVKAAEQVELSAQIDGSVTALNPLAIPGALLEQGEWLARLEAGDYQLEVQSHQADLTQAETTLAIEQGRQRLARKELRFSNTNLSKEDRALVLREPHIRAAQATIQQQQALLAQAQTNLSRTELNMPFRGQILARQVGRGSKVNNGSALYSLVGVAQFWLEVKVPRHFLYWLDQDEPALVYPSSNSPNQTPRLAQILSVLPMVDSGDRQAIVLLAIDDPLSLNNHSAPPVRINEFVKITLFGRHLENSANISLNWLLPNNRVWVVNDLDELEQRQPDIGFRGRTQLLVTGLKTGDRVVSQRLEIASPGMKVAPYSITVQSADTPL